jgi:hypothetical protein
MVYTQEPRPILASKNKRNKIDSTSRVNINIVKIEDEICKFKLHHYM